MSTPPRSAAEAFAGAGQAPGLQAWRVERSATAATLVAPVANADALAGKLHTGDSYVVLHTGARPDGGAPARSLFFWKGSETGMEAGAAAELAVELDGLLGGSVPPRREVQGCESADFLALFPAGLSYLPGGHSGGFTHVQPGSARASAAAARGPRLLRVSASHHGATAAADAKAPLDPAGAYILDAEPLFFAWTGANVRPLCTAVRAPDTQRSLSLSSHLSASAHPLSQVRPADRFAVAAEALKLAEAAGLGNGAVTALAQGDEAPAAFAAALALAAADK